MEYRQLEITIVSAKGLKKVKDVPQTNVYLEAYVSTNPNAMQMTPISNVVGGNNPEWNFTIQFTINEAAVHQKNAAFLVLRPKCVRPIGGDKELGECRVPLNELFGKAGKNYKSHSKTTYPVKKPKSGKEKGELRFSFMFGDMFVPLANNVMPQPTIMPNPYAPPPAYQPPPPQMATPPAAYPPPPPAAYPPASASYAPAASYPPAGYPPAGYAQQGQMDLPPQPGYYPAAQTAYGYGYAPPTVVQPQMHRQSSDGDMALGMGAAFVGGMVGGMVLSDAAYAAGD